ncbi:unnamed protein product [Hermetia illucens]|uniref:Uncharacterized protein n=1 Tax=Hermetia illucens TaxID=343691 RepID=A0A7R8UUV0_HERIL|nr:zinc finger protein 62 homolog isoform X1 [Hermetia illucens]CAD7087484.1 unnamed protein product [Hermetia illucens]
MTESTYEFCLICKAQKKDDFGCLFVGDSTECRLSELGSLLQDMLQVTFLPNELQLHLCGNCTEQVKQFHEFKIRAIESYKNLLELTRKSIVDPIAFGDSTTNGNSNCINSEGLKQNGRIEEVSVFNEHSETTENFQIKYLGESDEEDDTITNLQGNTQQSPAYDVEILNDYHHCDKCDEIFWTVDDLKKHKQVHIEPNQCDFCSEVFWDDKQYMDHLYHHINYGPPFQCKKCPQKYQDKKYFVEHLTFHVFGLKCEKCDKMFYRKNLLQVHLRTTHATERRYGCRTCGKRFKSSSHLRNHYYSHMGKQFQCPMCPNRYSTPRTLRDHFKSIHKGDLPFSCEVCEQLFLTREELLGHIREQHLINATENNADVDAQ